MKLLTSLLLLFVSMGAHAVQGTIDTEGIDYCETTLQVGIGSIKLVGNFDSATVSVYTMRDQDGPPVWDLSKSYTATPSPNPEVVDFKVPTRIKLLLSSVGASTSVFCEVRGAIER